MSSDSMLHDKPCFDYSPEPESFQTLGGSGDCERCGRGEEYHAAILLLRDYGRHAEECYQVLHHTCKCGWSEVARFLERK